MRTVMITMCLAAMPTVQAQEIEKRSVFEYSKTQGLGGQLRAVHDIVVLKDGTQLQAQFSQLPSLVFSFGSVSLDPKDISYLSLSQDFPGKVQVKMCSGETYTASMGSKEITFAESISKGTSREKIKSKVLLKELGFILFKPRRPEVSKKKEPSMYVTLQNGDSFPAEIVDKEIVLSSGWKEWGILSSDVVSLSFNGGIYGRINDDGKEVDLPLSFLKNSHINLRIPSTNQSIRLSWEKIDRITSNQPRALFVADAPLDIPSEVKFIEEPPVLFASNDTLDLPDDIVFEEGEKMSVPELIAVGEDFDLNDLEENVPEEAAEDTGDEVEFVAIPEAIDSTNLVAVGEDFNLDDLDEETPVETTEDTGDEVEFVKVNNDPMLESTLISYGQSHKRAVETSTLIAENTRQIPEHGAPKRYQGMVHVASKHQSVSGYYIKPRKVTNLEYKLFVDAVQYQTPSHWAGGNIPEGMEDLPVVNVSYKDAFLYAVWAGKRLPSLEELESAVTKDLIASNEMDEYLEWTSTPTLHVVRYQQPPNMTHTGSKYTASHQVCGRGRVMSLKNEYSNNNTSFRVASDAH